VTPKTAHITHFQTSLSKIQGKVDSFIAVGGEILLKVYHPDQDYSNNFMHVVNSGLELLQSIDWDKVTELAYQETVGDKGRQHKFNNVGTTGVDGFILLEADETIGVLEASEVQQAAFNESGAGIGDVLASCF
jgi:hypothetical protein